MFFRLNGFWALALFFLIFVLLIQLLGWFLLYVGLPLFLLTSLFSGLKGLKNLWRASPPEDRKREDGTWVVDLDPDQWSEESKEGKSPLSLGTGQEEKPRDRTE